MPPPLTFHRALVGWQFDPLTVLAVLAAAVLYAAGVRRIRRTGRRWPPSRTWCFCAGLAVVAVATMSGLAAYEDVLFSVHMVQHLLLGMVAPLLLALGAPVSLLFGAAGPAGRRRAMRTLRSGPIRLLGHPGVAWALFVASPFVLYFSPLYGLSLRNGFVHALVHVHFLVAGSLFCWPLAGVDPVPHRQPPGARMLYAVLALPFHAFLGIAIMGSTTVFAGDYYAGLGRTWGSTPLQDQNAGGGLLWAAGDLVGFAIVVLILRQWVRGDAVTAAREDRRIDAVEAALVAEKDGTRPN
jgi:putative copper resistance protein D